MEYRKGTNSDLDDICSLIEAAKITMENQQIYQWDELYPVRMDFEEDIQKGNLYVVLEGTKLVAIYAISSEFDDEYNNANWEDRSGKFYIIHRFCVSPEYQNRGLGRTILTYIEEQIKTMGFNSVRLDVFTQNPYALKLYRRNGYEERGYADWRKGRFILMEKRLV